MRIKEGKEQLYKEWLSKQTDNYSKACFVYAEAWAGLLEARMIMWSEPIDIIEKYAEKYSHLADEVAGGITGFMYGVAVNILAQCWEYGDYINKWHNRKYGRNDDEPGTVNPAIITLG
jgi:hypothetical protein